MFRLLVPRSYPRVFIRPLPFTRAATTSSIPQPILEKYRAKLASKAKAEGLQSVEDLKAAYAEKISAVRNADATLPKGALLGVKPESPVVIPEENVPTTPETPAEKAAKAAIKAAKATGSSTKSGVKHLNEILDMSKASVLPERELTAIWRLRHAHTPNTLCASIPAATYKTMHTLAQKAPQFVLPVPHPTQGAEMHFLQWTFDAATKTSSVLFTQLAEYKLRGEFAQPHTTVTHWADFAEDKGVVLMQGQVVEGRGVSLENAQFLVMCLQRFYGGWEGGEERLKLVEAFAKGGEGFSVEKLLEETEKLA